ncbi:MAG: hypothetical protein K2H64_03455 [Desulfovibrio sp.]|nr:hypothetical protein [Desulfovibrio sp.]
MSRTENLGHREELRIRRKAIEAEIRSHAESMRCCLPLIFEPVDLQSEYLMHLAIKLNGLKEELTGVIRKIEILERDLGLS